MNREELYQKYIVDYKQIFDPALIERAKELFYFVRIDIATKDEVDYYADYFSKYPNKGNIENFRPLLTHITIYVTDWQYEEENYFYHNDDLRDFIAQYEHDVLDVA